jgi:YD repeat-containing protein
MVAAFLEMPPPNMVYDERDRLTAIYHGTVSGGVQLTQYGYNSLSQRISTTYGTNSTWPVTAL